MSYSAGVGSSYLSHKTISVDENETIHLLPSLNSSGNSLKLRISQFFSFFQVLLFILIRTVSCQFDVLCMIWENDTFLETFGTSGRAERRSFKEELWYTAVRILRAFGSFSRYALLCKEHVTDDHRY